MRRDVRRRPRRRQAGLAGHFRPTGRGADLPCGRYTLPVNDGRDR